MFDSQQRHEHFVLKHNISVIIYILIVVQDKSNKSKTVVNSSAFLNLQEVFTKRLSFFMNVIMNTYCRRLINYNIYLKKITACFVEEIEMRAQG